MTQVRFDLPPVSHSINFCFHSSLNVVNLSSWCWVTALKSMDYRDRAML